MIKKLSDSDIISILNDHDHITLYGDESREELEKILKINVDEFLIDEIEIITILGGE